jgi:MOSC domain-containing protein YiiM
MQACRRGCMPPHRSPRAARLAPNSPRAFGSIPQHAVHSPRGKLGRAQGIRPRPGADMGTATVARQRRVLHVHVPFYQVDSSRPTSDMAAAGVVQMLFTSGSDGDTAPMQSHQRIECVAGSGVRGDRYEVAEGASTGVAVVGGRAHRLGGLYSERQNTHWHLPEPGRQLTLFDGGALRRLREQHGLELRPEQTRRNVIVVGLSLNALVGHELVVGPEGSSGGSGSVRLFVHRLTVPCQNLQRRSGLAGLEEALWDDGGVSCEIVSGGWIRQGDLVRAVAGSYSPEQISTPKVPAFFVRPSQRTAEDHTALAEMNAALAQMVVGEPADDATAREDMHGSAVPQQLGLLENLRRRLGRLIGPKL